ncbi:MAG: SpoIID/LytB domain-containing protein [Elusimicrobia bacterium]|nr:SpoIID/LytB domain-containing protein [Elusimicrobiota bacterium]
MELVLTLALLLAPGAWAAGPGAAGADARTYSSRGNALHFRGESQKALESYAVAVRLDPAALEPWINGAVVLEELGQPAKALRWYRKAASLPAADADVLDALAWAQLRTGDLAGARKSFQDALARSAEHAGALLGMARVELAQSRPAEAVKLLDRAAAAAPLNALIPFFKGQACHLLGDAAEEAAAYRQCVAADSKFALAREALALAQVKLRNFGEAWKHLTKALEADPGNKRFRTQLERLKLVAPAPPARGGTPASTLAALAAQSSLGQGLKGRIPTIRVGVGTDPMGKPVARQEVSFSANGPFWIADAKTGKRIARGDAGQAWQARWVARRKPPAKGGAQIELKGAGGRVRVLSSRPVVVRPDDAAMGIVTVLFAPCGTDCSNAQADRRLRGELEIAAYPPRKSLSLVNRVDLEDYTHGVIAMEMPIASPLEALKAQATLARSHAYYIKTMTKRHVHEGFDVCDTQHCQVYGGLAAESARSLGIAKATRGRIVTFKGKPAHVTYSSNCGGHTQSSRDLTGWGHLPYCVGVPDRSAPSGAKAAPGPDRVPAGQRPSQWPPGRSASGLDRVPASPWELRRWIKSSPPAFCKPSAHVSASSFRWAQVMPFADLEEKINRNRRIGRLRGLRPGRRGASGHLNSMRVLGTLGSFTIDSEMSLRGMLGIGSLRSTLFVMDVEYKTTGKPATLVPASVIFYGGGWGHAVGVCQSGAMGRAEAGQSFEEIIKSYLKGVEISRLDY